VPYTGAASDVDLGAHDLATTGVLSSRGVKILGNYTIAWRNPADTVTNAYLHYDGNLQMRNVSGNITLQADLIDLGTTPLTTSGIITESRAHNDITNLIVENTENGTAAKAAFRAQSDGGSVSLSALSAGHLTSSQYKTDSALLEADSGLIGGLHLSAAGASEVGFWTNGTRRGSIWLDGKWKIGVGIPTEVLDVAGNIAVSGTVDGVDVAALSTDVAGLRDNSIVDTLHRHSELVASDGSPDPALSVDAAGNIGVGTQNPDKLFHVSGGDILIDNSRFLMAKDTGGTTRRIFHLGGDNNCYVNANPLTNSIRFQTSGTNQVAIDSTGRVGIGIMTPATSAKVDITSTTGALLLTRMTTVQKNALTAINGMVLYDSTLNKFQGYENGSWTSLI
jgi:hypothetical protein